MVPTLVENSEILVQLLCYHLPNSNHKTFSTKPQNARNNTLQIHTLANTFMRTFYKAMLCIYASHSINEHSCKYLPTLYTQITLGKGN